MLATLSDDEIEEPLPSSDDDDDALDSRVDFQESKVKVNGRMTLASWPLAMLR